MTKDAVIEILNEVEAEHLRTATGEALDIAAKCVEFLDTVRYICREDVDVNVVRAFIEGFQRGVFSK